MMIESARAIRYAVLCAALLSYLIPVRTFAVPIPSASTAHLQSLLEPITTELKTRDLSLKGWKTTAGSKVLFIRTTASPMFDLHVSFAAGSEWDNGTPGLAGATFSMLNEGVDGMTSSSAIMATFDGLGATLSQTIDRERAAFSLRSLSAIDKSAPALHLFEKMLGEPLLSDESLARVKNELKDKLHLFGLSQEVALEHLMPHLAPLSPYAYPVLGTKEGLESLNGQTVRAFHQKAYSAQTAQITLVGDLTLERAQLISQQISNALPTIASASPSAPPLLSTGTPITKHVDEQKQQTVLILAQSSAAHQHDDDLALRAAYMIFGDGWNSRLMTELREKRGLVYGVDMRSLRWTGPDLMTITLQISPQYNQDTQTLIQSMFRDYLRDGPTQQELDRLKSQLENEHIHGSANNAQILRRLVEINRHDLPLDLDFSAQQMQRLSLKQIKDALNRHFSAERWHVVTVGPKIEQQPLPLPVSPSADATAQGMCPAAQTAEAG